MHHFFTVSMVINWAWSAFLIGFFSYFWNLRIMLRKSRFWPRSKAQITHFEWEKSGHAIWPKIEYSFLVYEHLFHGNNVLLDTKHTTPNTQHARHVAYKIAMAYKNNTEIEVYYDPNNPERSALDITVPNTINAILIMLGLLIILQSTIIFFQFLY